MDVERTKRVALTAIAALALAFAGCSSGDDSDPGGGGGETDTTTGQDTQMADAAEDVGQDTMDPDTDQDTGNEPCTSPTDVAGTAQVHPVESQFADSPSLAGGQVGLIAASGALSGNVEFLDQEDGTKAIEEFGSNSPGTSTTWSFTAVQTGSVSLGLIGIVDDASENSDDFITTASGLAGASDAQCDLADGVTFALSTTTEQNLASLVGPESGEVSGDPGSLIGTGFVFVMYRNAAGDPVEGVTATKNGSAVENTYYPDGPADDPFASVATGTGASTNSTGLAIIPDASLAQSPGYSGTKDGGPDFAAQAGGSPDGIAYAMVLGPASSGS